MDEKTFRKELVKRADDMGEHIMSFLGGGEHDELIKAMRHYPSAGGKRMRPVTAVAVAEAVGGKGENAIPFACAIEIVHNFTLVHDDVMDNDDVRRGLPAVHVVWDIPTAIIAGDAMFAKGFETLADTEVDAKDARRLLKLTANAIYLVAEGQQMDMENETQEQVSVERYLDTIQKKTAELFAAATEGGAIIGGGTAEQIASMREYAILMGIGFQIWDDVLGIAADPELLGKPVGSDIRNGKRTLIVLHALETMPEGEERHRLLSMLGDHDASDDDVVWAIDALDRNGSIGHARNMALEYAHRSKECLECLPECLDREFLVAMVDFSVGREL